jgi:hypothetical protein
MGLSPDFTCHISRDHWKELAYEEAVHGRASYELIADPSTDISRVDEDGIGK